MNIYNTKKTLLIPISTYRPSPAIVHFTVHTERPICPSWWQYGVHTILGVTGVIDILTICIQGFAIMSITLVAFITNTLSHLIWRHTCGIIIAGDTSTGELVIPTGASSCTAIVNIGSTILQRDKLAKNERKKILNSIILCVINCYLLCNISLTWENLISRLVRQKAKSCFFCA